MRIPRHTPLHLLALAIVYLGLMAAVLWGAGLMPDAGGTDTAVSHRVAGGTELQ